MSDRELLEELERAAIRNHLKGPRGTDARDRIAAELEEAREAVLEKMTNNETATVFA